MEYTALYTQLNGKIKAGEKAMIIFGNLEIPVQVFEDDDGLYFIQNEKKLRQGDISAARIIPVELSLCSNNFEEGDKCFVRDIWGPARKVHKITGTTVHFKNGLPKEVSRSQVFKRVATISEHVNFLPHGAPVARSTISFVVVTDTKSETRQATPETVIEQHNERLIAMVLCSHCGTLK